MPFFAYLNFWRNQITSLGPNEFHLDLLFQLQTGDASARTLNATCVTELAWPSRSNTSVRQAFRLPKIAELQRNSETNPIGLNALESLARSGLKPGKGLCFQAGYSPRTIPEILQSMNVRDPKEFKSYPVLIELKALAENFVLFHGGQNGCILMRSNQKLDPSMDAKFARNLKFIKLETSNNRNPMSRPGLARNIVPFGHEIPLWG